MHDSQTDWKPYLEKYHCQNECHHIWHGFWEYHTFLCDISVNSRQVVLMLRYLHINNWFDISQSLLLAVILVIFPEHWNHSLLVTFLTFSFSYSPPTLTSFQYHHSNYTPSPAELSYTIFFLGTFVCVTVTSTSPFTVCIFYLFIIILNVFCSILHFYFCPFDLCQVWVHYTVLWKNLEQPFTSLYFVSMEQDFLVSFKVVLFFSLSQSLLKLVSGCFFHPFSIQSLCLTIWRGFWFWFFFKAT